MESAFSTPLLTWVNDRHPETHENDGCSSTDVCRPGDYVALFLHGVAKYRSDAFQDLGERAVRTGAYGDLHPRGVDTARKSGLLSGRLAQRAVFQRTRYSLRAGDERFRDFTSESAELRCVDLGFDAGYRRRRRTEHSSTRCAQHLLPTRIKLASTD